jgi:hypothetical protein
MSQDSVARQIGILLVEYLIHLPEIQVFEGLFELKKFFTGSPAS